MKIIKSLFSKLFGRIFKKKKDPLERILMEWSEWHPNEEI